MGDTKGQVDGNTRVKNFTIVALSVRCALRSMNKPAFWRTIDDICDGVAVQQASDGRLMPESVREQSATAIKLYCSFHPPQSEIAEAVEKLMSSASKFFACVEQSI